MFEEYRLRVLQDYNEKKLTDDFSSNLIHNTTAKLKAECLLVLEKRYLKKDDKILQSFFGGGDDKESYRLAIKKIEVDKFRPLQKCIKGGTNKTDQRNIELLAWLIDFEHRPYRFNSSLPAVKAIVEDKEIIEIAKDEEIKPEGTNNDFGNQINNGQAQGDKEEVAIEEHTATTAKLMGKAVVVANKTSTTSRLLKSVFVASILIIVGIVIYWIYIKSPITDKIVSQKEITPRTSIPLQEKCMYWAGDHYQPVSCNKKINDTLVVALDSTRVIHFKKITIPDTITIHAIGHVWYVKTRKRMEYYTMGGMHPIYVDLRLKPVTKYIISKYCHKSN